jgi:hypothetical protein
VTAALLLALGVAAATSALSFWAIRWARENADKSAVAEVLRVRMEALDVAVGERDRLIATRNEEIKLLSFKNSVLERRAKDYRHELENLAAANPSTLGSAIRAQLERLRQRPESDTPPAEASGDPPGASGDLQRSPPG